MKGPVYFETNFMAVTAKGAKKVVGNGALVVNLKEDPDLAKFRASATDKARMIVVVGNKGALQNSFAAAGKVYAAGYKKTAVFHGDVTEIQ